MFLVTNFKSLAEVLKKHIEFPLNWGTKFERPTIVLKYVEKVV